MPTDKKERNEVLDDYKNDKKTVIFYEAPHRLVKTLEAMLSAWGDRKVCLARELTKLNEEIVCTTLEQALEMYTAKEPRGEYVLIVEGAREAKRDENPLLSLTPEEHVRHYTDSGMSKMDAIKAAARDRGVPKSVLYKELL